MVSTTLMQGLMAMHSDLRKVAVVVSSEEVVMIVMSIASAVRLGDNQVHPEPYMFNQSTSSMMIHCLARTSECLVVHCL